MPLSGAALASRRSASVSPVCGFSDRSFIAGSMHARAARIVARRRPPSHSKEVRNRSFCVTSGRLFRKNVADFLQQHFLARRLGGFCRLFGFLRDQLVEAAHDHEQHPGDDHEIDEDGDEVAPREHRALFLGVGQRRRRHALRQRDEIVREIEAAGHRADDRHEDVADHRLDDLAEGRADDHADRKIDHVAAHREFLEFLEHRYPPSHAPGRGWQPLTLTRFTCPGRHRPLPASRRSVTMAVDRTAERACQGVPQAMLQGWVVIVVALGYIGLLFVIASYGDSVRARSGVRARKIIYPLSLAIYCTSWTFFGSGGLASRTGYDFLTIYVGPIIMIGLASPLIAYVVRLAKAQNITSIADFIAARYGKHQAVAATVALIAIVGTIPYIALQLKAVAASLGAILTHLDVTTGSAQPVLGDIALFVALAMAAFAVLFGTRHIDATEHQDGLILAIATESLIKLVAFVTVGVFVTFVMFDGPAALLAQALETPRTAAVLTREPVWSTLITMTLLSTVAILLVPRQFHVTVVENRSEAEIRRAAWLFPLYLVLINLFVIPIAMAGLITFPRGLVDSDMYVLALPLRAGSEVLAMVAFVGGLSAATAMVIVETVALAIMASNDIVVPFVLQRREAILSSREDVGPLLLTVRRFSIFLILFLAYLYYRIAGDAQLAAIGLLSFAAIAQLAPAFFGGLIWRNGTARGALAGMSVGILVWAYTLL